MEYSSLCISSKENPRIKRVRSLQTKKGRRKHQQFIAQGFNVIRTLIQAGHEPTEIFCTNEQVAQIRSLLAACDLTILSDPVMRYIATENTPSGIIAAFNVLQGDRSEIIAPGLILARISDPGNMGALIRCAAAMGLKQVFAIECTDVWAPKVIQSSAGYIGSIDVIVCSWQDVVLRARQSGIPLAALVVRGGQQPDFSVLKPSLLVVGSESHGIPEQWAQACDIRLTLPMPGNTESLNVVSAASIALYLACAG